MDKKTIESYKNKFDIITHTDSEDESIEYWCARELMSLLGYDRWENFCKAIERAMDSCKSSNIEVSDHFRDVTKMIATGKGAHRKDPRHQSRPLGHQRKAGRYDRVGVIRWRRLRRMKQTDQYRRGRDSAMA